MESRARRTGTKVKPHESFAELRKLRESGKKRLEVYEVEQAEDLYEEVDEEDYKKVVRKRLDEDDFVVDDGSEGYADNGMDDWGDEGRYFSADEDDEDDSKLTIKEKKRKREEDKEKKARQEGDIHRYFNKANGAAPVKVTTVSTAKEKEIMNDLLGEFDTSIAASTTNFKKKRKELPVRRTCQLSPPRKASKKSNGFGIRSSPPPFSAEDDDAGFLLPHGHDDDISMSDAPIPPSSPAANAANRKLAMDEDEDEDDEDEDDDFTVAEIKGNKNIKTEKVNLSSSRLPEPGPIPETSPPIKAEALDSSSWSALSGSLNVVNSSASEPASLGKLAVKDAVEEDGSIKVFWIDYTEINGALILFGKVQDKISGKYVSAFLKVDGIMRNLFFLPREHRVVCQTETDEEVQMNDVHEEINNLMNEKKIDFFKAKPCSRKYTFELPGIPQESDYLKVLYPYTKPALPTNTEGETFSHVFGTNTALFEQFVLCRGIMGPCWLRIERPDFNTVVNASHCKLEIRVEKPQLITTIGNADSSDTPPLTLMSLALRTKHNIKENKQEIISISCRIYEDVSISDASIQVEKMPQQVFTVVRPVDQVFPPNFDKIQKEQGNIKTATTEAMLLNFFLAKLQITDPDVIMGHQLESVDWPVLLHRLKEKKTHQWSRIGRMKRAQWPSSGGRFAGTFFAERQLASGRLICDLANDLGKSLMTSCQSWSLTEMCDLILGTKRRELDNEEALKSWAKSGKGFLDYLLHSEVDTHFITAIAMKVQILPLAKQLTNLAGNSWARTLGGTRAERNEYILLHEFYKKKYICPDKEFGKGNKAIKDEEENPDEEGAVTSKKKDKYKGGLVFEPEKGLYDKFILVMDYNSLYPSIIQEYNICFTTVDRTDTDEDKVPEVPEEQDLGILPRLISALVKRRKQVKSLMKDKNATAVQKAQWDIKQQALKLTANSMYGCLGYTRSRFYARPLAMLTTYKGREILQNTKDLAESMSLQVIYGDTDSVMINTLADNYADAIKIGKDFKKQVNNSYRLLEIDIDNVFQRLLLHAKKKYAAMNCVHINGKLETKMEVKGLDMRRREYCQLSKDASSHILNEVFTGDEKEVVVERIHDYLRTLSEDIREGKPSMMKYTIYTKLGKNPEEYPNGKTMPQVQVALKKRARGEPVKAGDIISYIITTTATATETEHPHSEQHAAERAYATQDVLKKDSGLKPDPEWYLIKQIFPPIERLCGPIDGTDSLRLAECLGLDTRKYQIVSSTAAQGGREIHPLESRISDEERFKDVAMLSFKCKFCKEVFQFEGLALSRSHCSPNGLVCGNNSCNKILPIVSILAQVEHQLRQAVAKYYEAWLVCDDSSCGNRTRQMSVYGKRCLGPRGLAKGCRGVMHYEYTAKMLYNQLLYFQRLFDTEKTKEKANLVAGKQEREIVEALTIQYSIRFKIIKDCIRRYLDKNGRQSVAMDSIFGFMIQA